MSFGGGVTKLPVDVTEEVLSTPELDRFVNYKPNRQAVDTGTGARFGAARRDLQDSVDSPYSGIPSQVGRQRLLATGMGELAAGEAQAYNDTHFDNEEFMANLLGAQAAATRKTRRHGYDSQPRQGGGLGSTLIGAAATLAPAFI